MTDLIARRAATLWGFGNAPVSLVAQRENTVFHIDAGDASFALRLHRKGYRSDAELQSELQWILALSEAGMQVPGAVASRQGKLVELVDGVQVDVLTWVPGAPLGARGKPLQLVDRAQTFYNFGREMAHLHQLSDAWRRPDGFARKQWDAAGLLGETPQWGRFWENPALDSDQKNLFSAARAEAARQLAALHHPDIGLIHADLVPENVLIDGERVIFIDFDDGGPGYRLYDLATALLRHCDEHDYSQLREAMLEGYRCVRPIDDSALPLFMTLKACAYVGWSMQRLAEPENAARNQRFIATALPLVTRLLADSGSAPVARLEITH